MGFTSLVTFTYTKTPKSRQPGSPALAKEPEEITLLDVYRAVEDQYHLLHIDEQTNPDCPIGKNIQGVLTQEFAKVQAAAEAAMQEITLAEITANLQERIEG